MKTAFLSKLIYEDITGGQYVRLYKPFTYSSEILGKIVEIPVGFVCDLESVPIVKGTSHVSGVIHDYFCRKDSDPVVTKQRAAELYLEAQTCRDKILKDSFDLNRWFRRQFKTIVVRVAPGYFHKINVLASLEEVKK